MKTIVHYTLSKLCCSRCYPSTILGYPRRFAAEVQFLCYNVLIEGKLMALSYKPL